MNLVLRAAIIGAKAVVLATLLYSGGWLFAARSVEGGIADWIAQQRATGATVEHGAIGVDGWPLTLRASVAGLRLDRPGLSLSSAGLTADALPWFPTRIAVALAGPTEVKTTDPDGRASTITAPAGGHGLLTLSDGGASHSLSFLFKDVALTPPGGATVSARRVELAGRVPETPPASHRETGLAAALTLREVTLPVAPVEGLGGTMDRLGTSLRLQGPLPAGGREAVAAWSRDGGVVELDTLALLWGPLDAALTGTLALDPRLQPQAAMTAEVRGADRVLSALKGTLKPNQVAAARTMVAMLSKPSPRDGVPVLRTPVTVQDGGLFVGPLRLASLPPLVW